MPNFQQFAKEHHEELLRLTQELAVIPAPSHHEEKRAKYCLSWLQKNVSKDAFIDDAKNVICVIGDPFVKPSVLFMAHTDIVFDADTPLQVTERDGKLLCPGIGDDTAHVAMILLCAKYAAENPPKDTRFIFCANSCEEYCYILVFLTISKFCFCFYYIIYRLSYEPVHAMRNK